MKLKQLLLVIMAMALSLSAGAQQGDSLLYQKTKKEKFKEFADKHMRLSGYLQAGFEWNEANDPTTTFYLKRARVSLTGDFLKDKFDYRLQVDMVNANINDGGVKITNSPRICDLYIRYKPLNELNVQLGQYKIPFAIENELCGPTSYEFIEYSYLTVYLTRNNAKYDGIAATGRDIGAQLYGGFIKRDGYSIINYNVGVYNGAGYNIKDNNSSKDFVGRLIIKPIKGLSISGSYMYSETNFDGNKYMKAPRWSAGVEYKSKHWIARAEYAQAWFNGNFTHTGYGIFGYHFEKPFSIVARGEFIQDKLNIMNAERATLAFSYRPYKFLYLQLNGSYTFDHVKNRYTPGVNFMASAIF